MVHIKIPIPEKVSTNKIYAGMHWSKRNALKDLYAKIMMQFKGKFEGLDYPLACTYIFTFKGKPLDVSNCMFMVKLIEDGLKINGVIKDDTPQYVESISVHVQEGDKDEVEIVMV